MMPTVDMPKWNGGGSHDVLPLDEELQAINERLLRDGELAFYTDKPSDELSNPQGSVLNT